MRAEIAHLLDVTASTPGEGIYMVAAALDVSREVADRAVEAFRLASPGGFDSGYYRNSFEEGYHLRCAHAAQMIRDGWEP